MIPVFKANIQNGKLELEDKQKFKSYIQSLFGAYELLVRKPKKKRSNDQNAYYWGVVIESIAIETKNNPNDIHEFLRLEFLTKTISINRMDAKVTRSTADLSAVEFEEYLLKCRTWAGEFVNITIPLPNEINIDEYEYKE